MAIKKKIEKHSFPEEKIDEFIKGGGNTPLDKKEREQVNRFTLRIPQYLLEKIDADRKNRIGKTSRNNWILEAIHDKLTSF